MIALAFSSLKRKPHTEGELPTCKEGEDDGRAVICTITLYVPLPLPLSLSTFSCWADLLGHNRIAVESVGLLSIGFVLCRSLWVSIYAVVTATVTSTITTALAAAAAAAAATATAVAVK
uniref:Uncharacterized protein n=1 Tax=Glossina brevipalpis TaxID=37001 RepID=A0A1A9WEG7_9MUSC